MNPRERCVQDLFGSEAPIAYERRDLLCLETLEALRECHLLTYI